MTADLAQRDRTDIAPGDAKALVSEILAQYESAAAFDAQAVLEQHPGLKQYPSVVVDLAYEEFCRRIDAGEDADPEEFARRFPEVEASLLKLLEIHEYLDEHPDAFGAAAPPVWPQAGEDVGGFVLIREIGRGGFSRVFLASERDLGDRQVVLKICTQANEEAARLGQLDHPHIVPVHSVDFDACPPFTLICMPFLGSATLADVHAAVFADGADRPRIDDIVATIDRIEGQVGGDRTRQASSSGRSRRFALRSTYAEAIIQTGAEVCEALAYAHGLGICHGDVKPSNVLLTSDGRPLLLDFNLSTRSDSGTAVVGGTLPYMAPEQLQLILGTSGATRPEIDHRTDLFALGVTLFQMLTGRLPFPTEDLPQDRQEAARRLLDRQRSWNDCRIELDRVASPAVARLITSCLALDRESRPDSAAQVAKQLRAELGGVAKVRNCLRRHKLAAISVALVLLMATAAMGIGFASRAPLHIRQYELGVSYLDAGDFASAARCFEGALEVHRNFPEALLLQGWSYLLAARNQNLNETEQAELRRLGHALFTAAEKRYGTRESAASLAYCLAEMSNHVAAGTYFRHAFDRGFDTANVRNNLGYFLAFRMKERDKGIVELETAIHMDPTLSAAHENLLTAKCSLVNDLRHLANVETDRIIAAGLKRDALDNLHVALAQIDAARELAPPTAGLEQAAARLYALAYAVATTDASGETGLDPNEMLEGVLSSCRAAVELGLPPGDLQNLLTIAPRLETDDTGFSEIVKGKPHPVSVVPTKPWVDVYTDVRTRLLSAAR